MNLRAVIQARRTALTGGQRRLADVVLGRPLDVAAMTITELAEAAGVSVASANRFATALGFRHFAEFRAELFAGLRAIVAPEVKIAALSTDADAASWHARAADSIAQNVAATFAGASAEALDALAERIVEASRIHVLGLGGASYIASYFVHTLGLYQRNVVLVPTSGGTETAYRYMMSVDADELMLVFTFPRYSRDAVDLADTAARRGAHVVALTDNASAPIAVVAHQTIVAGATSPVLASSIVGLVALAETLTTFVARRRPDAIARLQTVSAAVERFVYPAADSPTSGTDHEKRKKT
jgi:DNA-binding MurR/RpiR family transcriptional regulator